MQPILFTDKLRTSAVRSDPGELVSSHIRHLVSSNTLYINQSDLDDRAALDKERLQRQAHREHGIPFHFVTCFGRINVVVTDFLNRLLSGPIPSSVAHDGEGAPPPPQTFDSWLHNQLLISCSEFSAI